MEEKTLLYYRTAAWLTQKELAVKLGLTKENISAWENFKKNIPKKHVENLAKILRISTDTIHTINAIRKSNIQRKKTNLILQIQDQVEKNFPQDDVCFKELRKSMIWEIFQQDWSEAEKTKFAQFIAKYDTGWGDLK